MGTIFFKSSSTTISYVQMCQLLHFIPSLDVIRGFVFGMSLNLHSLILLISVVRCQQAKNHFGEKRKLCMKESSGKKREKERAVYLIRDIRWAGAREFSVSEEMVVETVTAAAILCF